MMRSLYSGISGLSVHQTKMDVIGNNIANVNTTAYKSSRVTFTDVFSQKLAGASAGNEDLGGTNPKQIGLGSNVGSIDLLMTEGAAQRTDNDLDIKIEGDGFFIVKDATGFKFTRDGSFKIDESGYLVTAGGNYVCGWNADANGNISQTPVNRLSMVTDATFSVSATKTTEINFGKNLNIEDGSTESTGITQLSTMYDSLGNEYTIKNQFYYISTEADVDTYNANHEDKIYITYGAGAGGGTYPAGADTANDTNIVLNGGLPAWVALKVSSITNAAGEEVYASDAFKDKLGLDPDTPFTLADVVSQKSGYPRVFRFNTDGSYQMTPDDPDGIFKLNFDAVDAPIEGINSTLGKSNGTENIIDISFRDLTQYNSSTTAASTYDGNKPGTMSSYSIGGDGVISAKYTNGETRILGQVALATFANSAGLEKTGDNMYQTTLNSGEFDGIGVSATSVGSLNAGALEMSNVNLSTEFTEMITTQRGFQANSRIITTSDSLLEELVNLKR